MENQNVIHLKEHLDCKVETSVSTLKTYVDLKFETLNKQLSFNDKALGIASDNLKDKLEKMNEMRDQLNQQANTFATKLEMTAIKEKFDLAIGSLNISRAELEGKATQQSVDTAKYIAMLGMAIGIAGIIIALIK